MWRYCCGVPLFVTVSLQTEDMRRRQKEWERWGGVVVVRGRGVWRKCWSMWLRIMSKKLHKAFSQITYQLYAWLYPWSISSVLDQVPIVLRCEYTCAHPHTRIHNPRSPLAANTWANVSLTLCLSLYLSSSQLIYIVFGSKGNGRNKICQVSYQ